MSIVKLFRACGITTSFSYGKEKSISTAVVDPSLAKKAQSEMLRVKSVIQEGRQVDQVEQTVEHFTIQEQYESEEHDTVKKKKKRKKRIPISTYENSSEENSQQSSESPRKEKKKK